MRIAFVSSGNSIHVQKIANYMVNHGHKITLYTLPNHNKLLTGFDKKITIKKMPFSGKAGYYLNAYYLKKELKQNKYDLLNCHYVSGYGTLARLTKFHPLSLAVFGSDVYDYPFKSKRNMRRVIKNLDNADLITSTSQVMANKVHEYYKGNKQIYVTPFGVDIDKFHPIKKSKNEFVFGTVKKMEYTYGIDILIKAYRKFLDNTSANDTKLLIYGRGSALEDFKNLAKDLGIDDKVSFEGFIDNTSVPSALSKIDVACFPSRLESFGVSAVEAMACGKIVISSDASGFTEIIENGTTGLIVPKNKINAFAKAMEKTYIMTDAQRKKMSDDSVRRAKQLYDFEQNMQYYDSLQKNLLKNELIELFGVSGVGKSTIAQRLTKKDKTIYWITRDLYEKKSWLNRNFQKVCQIIAFAFRNKQWINSYRSVIKKTGIQNKRDYMSVLLNGIFRKIIIDKARSERGTILLDEGSIQMIWAIYLRAEKQPKKETVDNLIKLFTSPDKVIYVNASCETIKRRLISRNRKTRIMNNNNLAQRIIEMQKKSNMILDIIKNNPYINIQISTYDNNGEKSER